MILLNLIYLTRRELFEVQHQRKSVIKTYTIIATTLIVPPRKNEKLVCSWACQVWEVDPNSVTKLFRNFVLLPKIAARINNFFPTKKLDFHGFNFEGKINFINSHHDPLLGASKQYTWLTLVLSYIIKCTKFTTVAYDTLIYVTFLILNFV